MARSTTKQVTGKLGTHEKTVTASGSSQQASKNSDWISALQVAQVSSSEVPTEEWKTRPQLEVIFNLKRVRMQEVINKLIDEDRIERKTFILLKPSGLRHIPHYRLK
jgi:hypothetical protein